MKHIISLAALLAVGLAQAGTVTSGTYGNLQWTAQNTIVGATSTATAAGGGDPRYFAPMPAYSGVASIITTYANGDAYICTGTLLNDRRSVLTAGHCVSDGGSERPVTTTVNFYNGNNPDAIAHQTPSFSYNVTNYFVHGAYTGNVIDHNDIAVLRLGSAVDAAISSYGLFTEPDLTGLGFNVAGYGARSDAGGEVGANLGTGRLRQGDNRFDFRLGDTDFGAVWEDILGDPMSQIAYSYLADFDSGNLDNDSSCLVAILGLGLSDFAKYCHSGEADEVGTAGGDSGGPGFINGRLASVTSYGLTFGMDFGDWDNALNSSFGEFSGFVPVYLHRDFIESHMVVPEPTSFALAGLALLMIGARRRG